MRPPPLREMKVELPRTPDGRRGALRIVEWAAESAEARRVYAGGVEDLLDFLERPHLEPGSIDYWRKALTLAYVVYKRGQVQRERQLYDAVFGPEVFTDEDEDEERTELDMALDLF